VSPAPPRSHDRNWTREAIRRLEADFCRSADTHLIRVELRGTPGVTLYLKDESVHPSGSLKHRLARSLLLYGLCNGWIGPDTVLVEATSGSTAVSEAYFARLIGLKFIAVVPRAIASAKIDAIRFQGSHADTYHDDAWLAAKGIDWRPAYARYAALLGNGE
jgi:cysteine synthase A